MILSLGLKGSSMEDAKEFLRKAYIDRQQVVFVDDVVYDAKVETEKKANSQNGKAFYVSGQ